MDKIKNYESFRLVLSITYFRTRQSGSHLLTFFFGLGAGESKCLLPLDTTTTGGFNSTLQFLYFIIDN